jgi:hypothetical protein
MVSVSVPGVRIGGNQHYASLPGALRSSSWHGGGLRVLFLFGRGGASMAADTKSQAWTSLFFSCLVQGDFPASSRFLLGVTVPWMMRLSTSTTRRCSYRFTTWAIRSCGQGRKAGRPPAPVYTASRNVSRMVRTYEHNPSVQNRSGRLQSACPYAPDEAPDQRQIPMRTHCACQCARATSNAAGRRSP